MCIYAYINKHARLGSLGGCSPRKFLEIRCSEIASGVNFGQKQSHSSYYFIQFLAVLHAFAKPADFKLPREKVLRLAEPCTHPMQTRSTGFIQKPDHDNWYCTAEFGQWEVSSVQSFELQ